MRFIEIVAFLTYLLIDCLSSLRNCLMVVLFLCMSEFTFHFSLISYVFLKNENLICMLFGHYDAYVFALFCLYCRSVFGVGIT